MLNMTGNKNLFVIAMISVVNALGYGIIIPILYGYGQRLGLSYFQYGLLFSIFSMCQFISTPVIGRLSDKYGRKPLLVVSLAGTVSSFVLMAYAPSVLWLFIARALDGITAGNLPVAAAVISDTTASADRAKGFGIIGASFALGFTIGPAISAATLMYGYQVPFLAAAFISLFALLITSFVLPETNTHKGEIPPGKLFDIRKLGMALVDEAIGETLLISFLYSVALSLFISVYQPFARDVLRLTDIQISINFTVLGLVGFISQIVIIPRLVKRLGEKKALLTMLVCLVLTFFSFFLVRSYTIFTIITVIQSLVNGFINPLLQALLSKETDAKSQGSLLGINASYQSLAFIIGPIIGGILITFYIPAPFFAGSMFILLSAIFAYRLLRQQNHIKSAF